MLLTYAFSKDISKINIKNINEMNYKYVNFKMLKKVLKNQFCFIFPFYVSPQALHRPKF